MLITSVEKYILAVDLGTSGCKTALVSSRGEVLGWEFQSVPTRLLPNGGAEHDSEDWWSAFLATAQRLLDQQSVPRERIAAICCSTQGEGTVAVDAGGQALAPCILWMDTRGVDHLKRITRGFINVAGYAPWRLQRWMRLTGGAPSLTGKDPAAHMLWIKYERPDVYAKTAKFLNVLDYMNLRLTGRYAATHDSILTSWVTDNRNLAHLHYDKTLLRMSGIAPEKFPDIVACAESLGPVRADVAGALGLPRETVVVAGAIDTTAAAIGSGAVRDFEAHLYIGTSSWIAAHVPFKKTDIVYSLASVPCAIPGRYLMIALQATAGGNLTFLRDKILYHKDELLAEERVPDVYKIMDRIAERTPPGSNGVIFTPWTYGERCPVDDPYVRASIHNLSLDNSREDIIRALLEGVALNTRWMVKPIERFVGRKLEALNIVGGGGNSDVWCQIFADVLDIPIRQVRDPIQANVRGAAFIALAGLRLVRYDDLPSLAEIKTTYVPRKETRTLYDGIFHEFVEIYKRNKGTYRRLNQVKGAPQKNL